MDSDTAMEALWQLERRLTESAGAMERDATSKSLSAPAAEKLANRAEGINLARTFVWDAIRERTTAQNGSNGSES
jgi:hypothetical protein